MQIFSENILYKPQTDNTLGNDDRVEMLLSSLAAKKKYLGEADTLCKMGMI